MLYETRKQNKMLCKAIKVVFFLKELYLLLLYYGLLMNQITKNGFLVTTQHLSYQSKSNDENEHLDTNVDGFFFPRTKKQDVI